MSSAFRKVEEIGNKANFAVYQYLPARTAGTGMTPMKN
jgi:hypothetical protein